MAKDYEVFVENLARDLPQGREIELTLKDLSPGPRKYENRVVRAMVSRRADQWPDADRLRARSWTGVLYPETWAIRIVAEVGELVPGTPHGETLRVL
ncbi:MAG: phenylphosphate carboxylase subunit gamma [Candidatus Rokubacteria bacterium]|nr:phenylphosphate carboxylase subunit gamma [Candidatus Rokubacteria bacterium]